LGGSQFEASPGKKFKRPYLKKTIMKKGWRSGSRCSPRKKGRGDIWARRDQQEEEGERGGDGGGVNMIAVLFI
jgi:hypothetical protein